MSYAVKFKQDTRFFFTQELAEKFCKRLNKVLNSVPTFKG